MKDVNVVRVTRKKLSLKSYQLGPKQKLVSFNINKLLQPSVGISVIFFSINIKWSSCP